MTAALDADDEVVPNPSCLLTELGDGTGVLLDLETKFYFTLNETGVFVWKRLSQGAGSAETLARAVLAEFEVDEAQAGDDLRTLLSDLVSAGLARSRGSKSPLSRDGPRRLRAGRAFVMRAA